MNKGPTWSQHKKVIDVSNDVYSTLPSGGTFDYFFVLFDGESGFVHLIEDSQNFDRDYRDYGKSVIGDVLGLFPSAWKNPQSDSEAKKRVDEFNKLYEPFNWTKELEK